MSPVYISGLYLILVFDNKKTLYLHASIISSSLSVGPRPGMPSQGREQPAASLRRG